MDRNVNEFVAIFTGRSQTMTRSIVKVALINTLVLLMDRSKGEILDSISHMLVAATSSCVAVGILSEQDGASSIYLSDEVLHFGEEGQSIIQRHPKAPRIARGELQTMTRLKSRISRTTNIPLGT